MIKPTPEEIEAAKTERGGWTRKQLAAWGVPWPPPKGWRRKLEEESEISELVDQQKGHRSNGN